MLAAAIFQRQRGLVRGQVEYAGQVAERENPLPVDVRDAIPFLQPGTSSNGVGFDIVGILGLGIRPPFPSWGSMLSEARDQITTAPWLSVFPGLAIFTTVLGLNLLGDGLRDILDPQSTTRRA